MARRAYFTGARRLQDPPMAGTPSVPAPQGTSGVGEVRTAAEAVDQLRVRLRLIAGGREFLTLAQVCHELLTSRGTYYRMVAAGTWPIPAIQPRISGAPKFHVDDVALFLRQSAACHADERLRLVRGGR